MRKSGRTAMLLVILIGLSGCTAMMVGGGSGGGYQPPKDQCDERDAACKGR